MNKVFKPETFRIANQLEILFVKIFGRKVHPPKDSIFSDYKVEVYKFGEHFYITKVEKRNV